MMQPTKEQECDEHSQGISIEKTNQVNPLSANRTKWSNTQTIRLLLPTN